MDSHPTPDSSASDWRQLLREAVSSLGWDRRFAALGTMPQILKLLWRSAPLLVSTAAALRISAALTPVAILGVTKHVIDIIVAARAQGQGAAAGWGHSLWPWLLLEFLLASAALILGRSVDYCDLLIADEFTRELSLKVMKHTADVDLAHIENPAFHDKLDRARVQATDRASLLHALGSLLQSSVMLVSLGIGVATYGAWLLGLMILCVLPAFAGESTVAFEGYSAARALTPLRRELDYLRTLGSSRESAKEVKMFGLEGFLSQRYRMISDIVMQSTRSVALRKLRWGSALGIFASLGYYSGYAFLAFEALGGRISVGTLTFLLGAVAGANVQLQLIFTQFSGVSEQALFLTDVVDFLNVEPLIASRPNAIAAPRPIRSGLEFRNVSFRYPGTERYVLEHLNLQIRAGERIALVGENGQGKTTIVKLITRLYEPTEGAIYLDGVDLRDYELDGLRQEVGVIFQDFFRYDMPVRDNIGVGRVELIADDDAIWDAVRKTHAERMVRSMKGQLDQMLGQRFEGGRDLSGGQWQKIALARAYLRDAQILILDEPTASLDAAAESEVFDNFADLTRGRMALLISHRFSTVRMVDNIIVLEAGKIKESGTHDELMAAGGQYAQLFALQAASYR